MNDCILNVDMMGQLALSGCFFLFLAKKIAGIPSPLTTFSSWLDPRRLCTFRALVTIRQLQESIVYGRLLTCFSLLTRLLVGDSCTNLLRLRCPLRVVAVNWLHLMNEFLLRRLVTPLWVACFFRARCPLIPLGWVVLLLIN